MARDGAAGGVFSGVGVGLADTILPDCLVGSLLPADLPVELALSSGLAAPELFALPVEFPVGPAKITGLTPVALAGGLLVGTVVTLITGLSDAGLDVLPAGLPATVITALSIGLATAAPEGFDTTVVAVLLPVLPPLVEIGTFAVWITPLPTTGLTGRALVGLLAGFAPVLPVFDDGLTVPIAPAAPMGLTVTAPLLKVDGTLNCPTVKTGGRTGRTAVLGLAVKFAGETKVAADVLPLAPSVDGAAPPESTPPAPAPIPAPRAPPLSLAPMTSKTRSSSPSSPCCNLSFNAEPKPGTLLEDAGSPQLKEPRVLAPDPVDVIGSGVVDALGSGDVMTVSAGAVAFASLTALAICSSPSWAGCAATVALPALSVCIPTRPILFSTFFSHQLIASEVAWPLQARASSSAFAVQFHRVISAGSLGVGGAGLGSGPFSASWKKTPMKGASTPAPARKAAEEAETPGE